MCGIFAYWGTGSARKNVYQGLKRLDYRGHDSWGIATLSEGKFSCFKKVGKIDTDEAKLDLSDGNVGVGHTRWATHGLVNRLNAHPHISSDKSFALVHNGIFENYLGYKKELEEGGYSFKTATDTEVIVRLIEKAKSFGKSLSEAIVDTAKKLEGRNTFFVLSAMGQIYASRNGSPLVVGKNDLGEYFFSSDTLSFAGMAGEFLVLDNGDAIAFEGGNLSFVNENSQKRENKTKFEKLKIDSNNVGREGFEHYMLKEIFESPQVISAVIAQPKIPLYNLAKRAKNSRKVFVLGSGTAGVAASQIAYFLRVIAGVDATAAVGAEWEGYKNMIRKNDLAVAVSQSGETADVLEVIESLKKSNIPIASYVNMPGSMITRLSNYKFMAGAGPEICVMSTKVFVSQIAWGYLLAKAISGKYEEGKQKLKDLSKAIKGLLEKKAFHRDIKLLSKRLKPKRDIFILGKGENWDIAKEGMIKIIEGTYKHAHAIPAGDLKHYAITLMETGVSTIALLTGKSSGDVLNAVNQIKARGALVFGISSEPHEKLDALVEVPELGEVDPILTVIPLQLLSYYMTAGLGNDVDKPRNIAKSVTVK